MIGIVSLQNHSCVKLKSDNDLILVAYRHLHVYFYKKKFNLQWAYR